MKVMKSVTAHEVEWNIINIIHSIQSQEVFVDIFDGEVHRQPRVNMKKVYDQLTETERGIIDKYFNLIIKESLNIDEQKDEIIDMLFDLIRSKEKNGGETGEGKG